MSGQITSYLVRHESAASERAFVRIGEREYPILLDTRHDTTKKGSSAVLCLLLRLGLSVGWQGGSKTPFLLELGLVLKQSAVNPSCYERIGLLKNDQRVPDSVYQKHIKHLYDKVNPKCFPYSGSWYDVKEETSHIEQFVSQVVQGRLDDGPFTRKLLLSEASRRSVTII